jgi:hypothetical protein
MPKALMSDIRTGSVELEDQDIDLADLDDAYEQDLDQESYQSDQQAKMHNNNSNNLSNLLSESLGFKDLDGMMKPTVHVDEFQ